MSKLLYAEILPSYEILVRSGSGSGSIISRIQWRSEGIWRPGANLNFAPPPPSKKFLKNDNKMSSIQLILCIIISA